MAEYIERESVFKIVADMMCDCKVRHKGRAINRNIKQLPTADVVEVVRCKDCKYHHKEKGGWCELHDFEFDSNDYCCDGERKCENGNQKSS